MIARKLWPWIWGSVQVHHVSGVKFTTIPHSVIRYDDDASENPDFLQEK